MNLISSQQSFRIFPQFMVFHVFSLVFEIHMYNERVSYVEVLRDSQLN